MWCRRLGPGLAPAGADPPGLKDRVAELFDSWVRLVEDAPCDTVHDKFVEEARAAGLLKARPGCWVASTLNQKPYPLLCCCAPLFLLISSV